jgi:hypothetical protein
MNTCKCIKEWDTALEKHNLVIHPSIHDSWVATDISQENNSIGGRTLNAGLVIPLVWIDPKLAPKGQKARTFFLIARFCPFCGKSIRTNSIMDPHGAIAHQNG